MSTKLRLGLRRDESPLACSPIRLRSGQADVHALDLEAAHAVDVRRLEVGVELLGPLGGGLLPEGIIVGLVSDKGQARCGRKWRVPEICGRRGQK